MEYLDSKFIISAYSLKQLPEDYLPEIAFAGRSNVGKSSLLNALLNRKNLVKVSGRPGKTQALNFFLIAEKYYCVDLPGYGYARVGKGLQADWERLITSYLESRDQLRCVVVIMDLRHEAKKQDHELIHFLQANNIPYIGVYTKSDKLSGNQRTKHAKRLDEQHRINPADRIIFSAKTKAGRAELIEKLNYYIEIS